MPTAHAQPTIPAEVAHQAPGSAAATWEAAASLVPWADNPRDNDDAVAAVAGSIQRFGWGAPIVARLADRMVIAGHTRLRAAIELLDLEAVPVRFLDVSRRDAEMLALADNKLGEIATWGDDTVVSVLARLAAEQEGVADLAVAGWTEAELLGLLAEDPIGPEDLAPGELPLIPDSEPGQVYALGPHRLACGDATDATVVSNLLRIVADSENGGGGSPAKFSQVSDSGPTEAVDCVWTDPPYGVDYGEKQRHLNRVLGGDRNEDDLSSDAVSDADLRSMLCGAFAVALSHTVEGGGWYVASPLGQQQRVFLDVLSDLGVWRQSLAWVKSGHVLSRSDYNYRHELILYGWRPGAAHKWFGDHSQDTVFEVPRPSRSKEHPTMKPVALVQDMLANSCPPGGLVMDPFGGSGSTLLAAARLGMRARLVELSPGYCDVIRRRWTAWAVEAGQDPGPGAL